MANYLLLRLAEKEKNDWPATGETDLHLAGGLVPLLNLHVRAG